MDMAHWRTEAKNGRVVLLAESFIINNAVNVILTTQDQEVVEEMTDIQMKQIEINKNIQHGIIYMAI